MKIAIGSDHRGFILKQKVIKILRKQGYAVRDFGTCSLDPCDYPNFAFKVANAVRRKRAQRGIIICKSGIGSSIAANKVPGIRAALCYTQRATRLSREHNDANVLVLGSDFVRDKNIGKILKIWLETPFAGNRHKRRIEQISEIEKKFNH